MRTHHTNRRELKWLQTNTYGIATLTASSRSANLNMLSLNLPSCYLSFRSTHYPAQHLSDRTLALLLAVYLIDVCACLVTPLFYILDSTRARDTDDKVRKRTLIPQT